MSERPLFRPEAVAHHAGRRQRRSDPELGERSTAFAFRMLLLALVLALLAAYAVRAAETARGDATVGADGRTAELLLPAAATPRLHVGQTGSVRLGADGTTVTVTSFGAARAEGGAAVVPVQVRLTRALPEGARGTGTVTLARPRVLDLVTTRLRALWGGGG